ncbi:Bug family tripartite tricarboxylate transporter substrate binding protein [Reyranella soli]|uniref:MFS transporter n=1 Tax=Reyranella soli TaxID=1230389 RepID=A0A512NDG9_9HYPH|nr:tripartite tricarboxylate transporter substrate-binding protein [Reyranella soli]GEP56982.1 MFS transporter [Reyranella soli]
MGAALTLSVSAGSLARAQGAYPDKPVRVTVSYGPGGAIDVVARILAEHMTNTLGKPVLVDNKPGAGSTIAAETIARSVPDGYSLLVTGMAHSVIPELFPQVTFDPVKSFQPISHLGVMPFVLAIHPAVPATDFASFIAYMKANPNAINCGSAGPGSSADLGQMLLAKRTAIEFVRVPYRSTPAAMNDLVAGRVGFMMDSQNVLVPHVKSGALRALAVSSLERSRLLPDVPTLDELGLKGFEAGSWQAMLAPAGTPRRIVDKIIGSIEAALNDPAISNRYIELGYQLPRKVGPEALAAFLAVEAAKWGPLAKATGTG